MTSGQQPINSGAPQPVAGVTGGPPVLGGQISNDPNDGSVVVSPNPGNVLQIRKGSQPTALQVYEYSHSPTDFSRLALNSQAGGPFQLAVETQPPTVVRDLQILAPGVVTIPNLQVPGPRVWVPGVAINPSTTSTTPVDMPDMVATFNLNVQTTVFAWFSFASTLNAVGNQVAVGFVIDGGAIQAQNIYQAKALPNNTENLSTFIVYTGLLPGSHTIKVQWSCQSGTLTAVGGVRYLAVFG